MENYTLICASSVRHIDLSACSPHHSVCLCSPEANIWAAANTNGLAPNVGGRCRHSIQWCIYPCNEVLCADTLCTWWIGFVSCAAPQTYLQQRKQVFLQNSRHHPFGWYGRPERLSTFRTAGCLMLAAEPSGGKVSWFSCLLVVWVCWLWSGCVVS